MQIQGQDVSQKSTKEIISMICSDNFPLPFTNKKPTGEINPRSSIPSRDYNAMVEFLTQWKTSEPRAYRMGRHDPRQSGIRWW
jgi:hypothetical protein